ncbi:glycosyltransferase [Bernardetia sp.]|uniref:glycosyltransferase n=1 Tax=Bernardetia sp. TaxID=1937974 RepID=UPI0025C59B8D|nr:glycosyltransferase [Bernardetia sp.]
MKKISVLIAVRNEEQNILSCLNHLDKSIAKFYQKESQDNFEIEILVGDDNSEDKSAEIIKEFIQKNEKLNFTYFNIENENNLKGKVKVVSQLIDISEGETIILLDADIFVTQNWLKELLTNFYQNDAIKMLMGTTIPKLDSNTFQTLDWIFGQGVLAMFSTLGFPQTAMGNNLIFDKKIYQEIGGYQNIEFSVTEDLALFKAFGCWWGHQKRQDNFFTHLFSPNALAFTESEPTLKDWILQRHRWLVGAWQFSNSIKKVILLIYLFRALIFIGMLLSGQIYIVLSVVCLLAINFFLLLSFFVRLKLKISFSTLFQILFFSLSESILYFLVGIYFLTSKKVKWKGREF